MFELLIAVHGALVAVTNRLRSRRLRPDGGQATAEYALVMLGAATIALLLVARAAKSGKVAELLDAVVNKVLEQV